MIVDSYIVNAIHAFVSKNNLSYESFAKKIGVSNAAMTKWKVIGNGITDVRWQAIFPYIKEFLPEERIYIDDAGKEQYSSTNAKSTSRILEAKSIPVMVPAFEINQIKDYDDTIDSITQFGENKESRLVEYRPKHKEKKSVFAVILTDNKLSPVLPQNTTLFVCAGEKPGVGNLVVALKLNGDVIIGSYGRTPSHFIVTPVDKSKNGINSNIKDARQTVKWIFPVLYYEVVTFEQ